MRLRSPESQSLAEVHSSVDTESKKGFWRKLFAFLGPAYLVSVGYMDPGNWATDIAGGSQFGYKLLWVLVMSNLMAVLLQSLCARLGIVRNRDLAQASREYYHPIVNIPLYILAEIAIVACDLAEVLGMAIGLHLLFDIPLIWGVCLTALDTFLLLFLLHKGIRKMEAFILALIAIIGAAFFIQMILAKPEMSSIAQGFIPEIPNSQALYIAIGIIGATVMPHNLYLHSSLVQTRKIDRSDKGIFRAIKYNIIDSAIALNLAFFVNAAILILAAATFYENNMFDVADIEDAHRLLEGILGTKWAPILFAVALIAAGQSSTITGTLAGQIVMEGYLNLRIQPWIRRIITRLLAILPAVFFILYFGGDKVGELLIFSQVVLSLQLGFAIIPLIHFVSDKKLMGKFVIGKWAKTGAWLTAIIVVILNVKLVIDEISLWASASEQTWHIHFIVLPLAIAIGVLLLYITFQPFVATFLTKKIDSLHGEIKTLTFADKPIYKKIAVSLDFSDIDEAVINNALALGNKDAEYLIVHVVETAGAHFMGNEIKDLETKADKKVLDNIAVQLEAKGYKVKTALGYGSPKKAIPFHVKEYGADILVMGSHGHQFIKDIILGTTINSVRHNVDIPVLIIREK